MTNFTKNIFYSFVLEFYWNWLFYKMVQVEDLTTGLGRSCGGGSVYNPSKYNLKGERGHCCKITEILNIFNLSFKILIVVKIITSCYR